MSEDAVSCRLDRIRALNDGRRANLEDGEWVLTDGIAGLSNVLALKIIHAVRTFAADNALRGEHDFGVVTVHDVTAVWKIDCYDLGGNYASSDFADAEKTRRILTVMLAEEHWGRGEAD